jgi:hypothetical protein
MTATAIHTHLQELFVERALAELEGLHNDALYMADLEDEIVAANEAYIGAAVTEIALLRSDLSGPLVG